MDYKVLKKCYYGEKGRKPRLYYAGEIYSSDTLKPKDAPKYLEPLNKKVETPSNDGEQSPPESSEDMTYQEMLTFVKENNIEVADNKKDTLIEAIKAYQETPSNDGE